MAAPFHFISKLLVCMMRMRFTIQSESRKNKARAGMLRTAHGVIRTPFFMPIATKAAVKTLEASEVRGLGAEIILSNTYHAMLQPGVAVIKKHGGLHEFMRCALPLLTDSGGFQVFSLATLRKITEEGVEFQSHIDGSRHMLTPEKSIDIQVVLGSDIIMVLDYFPGYPATRAETERSVGLTTRWAARALAHKKKLEKKNPRIKRQMLFGIVQGSTFRDLRIQSAKELVAMNFDGYAVGGLAVGEPAKEMYKVLDYTVPLLPATKPRYLMGVGYPDNIIEAVRRGIDMFDCVIPTREGRHGRLFVRKQKTLKASFWDTMNIRNSTYKIDTKPVEKNCDCPLCSKYSRAYLHHLFKTDEMLGQRLATMHNIRFFLSLMGELRVAILRNLL